MIDWLIVFMVHSTCWCGLAWLALRLRPSMRAQTRETIWLIALVASLLTPTMHTVVAPGSGLWTIPVPSALHTTEFGLAEHGHQAEHASPAGGLSLSRTVTGTAWITIAALLLLGYVGRRVALQRRLAERTNAQHTPAAATLSSLSCRAGRTDSPLLTVCDDLGSPIAIGLWQRREICLPTRALHELDDEETAAMLAHELAHHLRRDPLRLTILNVLQAVVFMQPLVRIAVRDLRAAAEEQCDDWAARVVDDRHAMASCLAEVARWLLPQDRRTPVPCMAQRTASLRARINRLLDEGPHVNSRQRAWSLAAAVVILSVAPALAPSVGPTAEPQHVDGNSEPGARHGHFGEHHGEHDRHHH